jgi:hypothetical protein
MATVETTGSIPILSLSTSCALSDKQKKLAQINIHFLIKIMVQRCCFFLKIGLTKNDFFCS